mmetsp:Transcript_3816/g.10907  ORF Transcript_3816/g.10907 Transcript_3816/m.10907 type:complete len:416 (-) Transcript_3816:252-1499(-)
MPSLEMLLSSSRSSFTFGSVQQALARATAPPRLIMFVRTSIISSCFRPRIPFEISSAPSSSSSFSDRSRCLRLTSWESDAASSAAPSGVTSLSCSSTCSTDWAARARLTASFSIPVFSMMVSFKLTLLSPGWAPMASASAPDTSCVRGLSCRSIDTRFLPHEARAFAIANPPSDPTLLDAILKSSSLGHRAITLAMDAAPSHPLMLLSRWIDRISEQCTRSSSTAAQPCTEHPTFWNAMCLRAFCPAYALAHARMPFSPSALSLKSRLSSWASASASLMMESAWSASSSGRPAIISDMSACLSVALIFRMALAATCAASTPKLFVLNLILDTVDPSTSIDASFSSAMSAVKNSLAPVRSSEAPSDACSGPPTPSISRSPFTASKTSALSFRAYAFSVSWCGRKPVVVLLSTVATV